MSTPPTCLIRHPDSIPLELQALPDRRPEQQHMANTGHVEKCAELAFHFPVMLAIGALFSLRIPSLNAQEELHGQVVWLIKSGHDYVIGMSFESTIESFHMRMLEQCCHIEAYRQQEQADTGRQLSQQQAAMQWIARYAAEFPSANTTSLH